MAAHLEPAYHDHPRTTLPVTERLTARSLILPLFHEMTEEEQDVVVSVIQAAAGSRRRMKMSSVVRTYAAQEIR